ncbi:hypothetical protein PHYBLDRAFT_146823 [Phycomyces blakesleeanus NRRL 1555(-)]|uniref:Uncharacterized protein n=1 Tax=Phycomyces blakesleeanus (strain ATCC 8743b / DSM 1359 / FGSC 10004 / NBRC 33097 / NRRL 1555) TaxID=763407 RepID=A0A162NAM8_PHYB8|nr:hypothetical protein PHYBLDRAFT_146823 [Phycomyces blakesleeanus NRRL 1555(-)]OAD72638.1 hypothetical protein PHYBLDRAFT_146823 [Phycomyces blakesleeanus NRRL 1555(-)]|eukprot:XP_018290678.1 hypothetical protein PHYBLDRAFT_146823 [Phycomyces blakesleeanus NRRL 1555(-)]
MSTLFSSVIHSQTQTVLTTPLLTINEGPFSISNRPIAGMVQSYTHFQPEVEEKSLLEKLAGPLKTTKNQFTDKENLESKFVEIFDGLLEKDTVSNIESDEEEEYTTYSSRKRQPLALLDPTLDVVRSQREIRMQTMHRDDARNTLLNKPTHPQIQTLPN